MCMTVWCLMHTLHDCVAKGPVQGIQGIIYIFCRTIYMTWPTYTELLCFINNFVLCNLLNMYITNKVYGSKN